MPNVILVPLVLAAALVAPLRAQTRVVRVVARDFSLDAPPTVPAGLVTFALVNKGATDHELVVERLPEGIPFADFVREATASPERRFEYPGMGGPEAPADSTRFTLVTVDLSPGRYVIGCFHTSGGRVHFSRGMYRQLVVLPTFSFGRPPFTDAKVEISAAGVTVQPTIRAGARVFEVHNERQGEVDVLVGRLRPGRTIADVQRWQVNEQGERPYVSLGGVASLSRGRTAHVAVLVEKGDYLLITTERDGRERRTVVRQVVAN
jgi:hypothetical protein